MLVFWKNITGLALALAALAGPAAAAPSIDLNHPSFAPTGRATSIPIGALKFCKTHSEECRPAASSAPVVELTSALWDELTGTNDLVNTLIAPETDPALYQTDELWTYPTSRGDCEDYALEKRRQLITLGWSPNTLLMTVVRQGNGDGHAVLMVRTDRGDLVLDNQEARILVWRNVGYQFVKRQAHANLGEWVSIEDTRDSFTASN